MVAYRGRGGAPRRLILARQRSRVNTEVMSQQIPCRHRMNVYSIQTCRNNFEANWIPAFRPTASSPRHQGVPLWPN
ncbi:protein of unknown function (plasmid) [Cupriavidus taiwanensis]|uniref:Uncharacterized protein n=1 Tax=Cupriavidus taiwanensis TaxID=164546 RepID=A0A9Q7UWA5_9BURK|nr:protein of unknown function [Cupriavidus taiwanensis]